MPRAFTEAERAAIRARIVSSMRRSLVGGGARRTPISALTRAAGISKGAFYQFFESKEAVVAAVLLEAEAELRAQLVAAVDADDPLRTVLSILFSAVAGHPMLAFLADPEEFAWLTRGVSPERLASARADDDRFFTELLVSLKAVGAVDPQVDPAVFAGLAPAALALAQQAPLIGARAADVTDLLVEGLVMRLAPKAP